MPAQLPIELILKIIKLRLKHPTWGWKTIGEKTEVSKNTAKKYFEMFERSDLKEIEKGCIPRQQCKDCNIIILNAFYTECPICEKKMK